MSDSLLTTSDYIVIGSLLVVIIILTILGISVLKKTRSLANSYLSGVFFMGALLSTVNVAIRVISLFINSPYSTPALIQTYMVLIPIVIASMVSIFILYGTGFYIINFGQRYYRDKKLFIVFFIIIVVSTAAIIGSNYLFPGSIEYVPPGDVPDGYSEYFKFSFPFGISLVVICFLFVVVNVALLVRILPEAQTPLHKRKIIGFILVITMYFLGAGNVLVVDMQIPQLKWNYTYISSIFILISVLLLYFTILGKRKDRGQNKDQT